MTTEVNQREVIEQIRARLEKATPAPWFWDGGAQMNLRLMGGRRLLVMDFVRWGLQRALPRFRNERILMERADALFEFRTACSDAVVGINNPDAELIENAPTDIKTLLQIIDKQRVALEFYADRKSYIERPCCTDTCSQRVIPVMRDNGSKANGAFNYIPEGI
jgi:hypothetical protein